MLEKNSSVIEVAIILGLIGFFLLGGIFILSSKYHKTTGNDELALRRTLTFIEKSLSQKAACINTISKVKISYVPQNVTVIQSGNNYTEMKVGAQISNTILFKKMTLQQLYREKNRLLLLMNFIFDDLESKKTVKYLRLFHVQYGSNNKIEECVMGQRIIL